MGCVIQIRRKTIPSIQTTILIRMQMLKKNKNKLDDFCFCMHGKWLYFSALLQTLQTEDNSFKSMCFLPYVFGCVYVICVYVICVILVWIFCILRGTSILNNNFVIKWSICDNPVSVITKQIIIKIILLEARNSLHCFLLY